MPSFHIQEISGPHIQPWLDKLGELRIRVFREFPYLYDGSLEYERDYLGVYERCADSRVVLVTNESGGLIGATTCLPLAAEGTEFRAPFEIARLPVDHYLYLGESVVRREWRGRGLGKEFFARREAHARRLGLGFTTFCAVDRPAAHPLRPLDYRPLDPFWTSQGYTRQDHLQAEFSWKEIDEPGESPKSLTFWTKPCSR
jgi:GNAT superfamily N-acetyltransferase